MGDVAENSLFTALPPSLPHITEGEAQTRGARTGGFAGGRADANSDGRSSTLSEKSVAAFAEVRSEADPARHCVPSIAWSEVILIKTNPVCTIALKVGCLIDIHHRENR